MSFAQETVMFSVGEPPVEHPLKALLYSVILLAGLFAEMMVIDHICKVQVVQVKTTFFIYFAQQIIVCLLNASVVMYLVNDYVTTHPNEDLSTSAMVFFQDFIVYYMNAALLMWLIQSFTTTTYPKANVTSSTTASIYNVFAFLLRPLVVVVSVLLIQLGVSVAFNLALPTFLFAGISAFGLHAFLFAGCAIDQAFKASEFKDKLKHAKLEAMQGRKTDPKANAMGSGCTPLHQQNRRHMARPQALGPSLDSDFFRLLNTKKNHRRRGAVFKTWATIFSFVGWWPALVECFELLMDVPNQEKTKSGKPHVPNHVVSISLLDSMPAVIYNGFSSVFSLPWESMSSVVTLVSNHVRIGATELLQAKLKMGRASRFEPSTGCFGAVTKCLETDLSSRVVSLFLVGVECNHESLLLCWEFVDSKGHKVSIFGRATPGLAGFKLMDILDLASGISEEAWSLAFKDMTAGRVVASRGPAFFFFDHTITLQVSAFNAKFGAEKLVEVWGIDTGSGVTSSKAGL